MTAKKVKTLVLDLAHVKNPSGATFQELRNLVCDGWQYGFKDGSKLSEGEFDKMIAYIAETERQIRRKAA